MRSVIFGCRGTVLSASEATFFAQAQPWGFILFKRNCETAAQIQELCGALRASVGREDAPILIDQEGGRVARLAAPHWPERPPMSCFGALTKLDPHKGEEAAFLGARLIASDLTALGITVNCVPVLDVPQPDAHEIIGDRALATHPDLIAQLGRQIIAGCRAGGVLPVLKHIPGHGRGLADSHLELPRVSTGLDDLRQVDFTPFRALNQAPLAMTAHIVYEAIDKNLPATLSAHLIDTVIRGEIGFDGVLMSDDLSMKALQGSFEERTAQALAAGCDVVLHCNGDMAEMRSVSEASLSLTGVPLHRTQAALAWLTDGPYPPFDKHAEEIRFAQLLKPVML